MSIALLLARQSLIAQKNNLQLQILQNSSARRSMLNNPSFTGNLEAANSYETALELENITNSAQLMAINAELEALNNSKINYLA